MADKVKIQVIFKEPTQYGEYCDAIYYQNQAEYDAAVADGSHEAEKVSRVANYLYAIANPPPPPADQFTLTAEDGEVINA